MDPNELVTDVLELTKERAGVSGVSLRHDLDPGLGTVSMEKTGIHRCLLNLISNAIDACTLEGIMEGNGVVTVKTDRPAGCAVRFQVLDNGTGMSEDTKKQLFTGFFSTKGYKGTGLGLPVTQKIVKNHGGELSNILFRIFPHMVAIEDVKLPDLFQGNRGKNAYGKVDDLFPQSRSHALAPA